MKISVLVKTKSKKESVERLDDGSYIVRVNVPPVDGNANKRVLELLAKYLDRPKSALEIISGHKSKNKIIGVG